MERSSRPYFKIEVKVKKKKAEKILILKDNETGKHFKVLQLNQDLKIGDVIWYKNDKKLLTNCEVIKIIDKKKKRQLKGNRVNGENLDKIKFPCFCSYTANDKKWLGEINKSWIPREGTTYYLSSLNGQKECSIVTICHLLEELIEGYDIHILKGKIIIFDEDGG